MKDKQTHTFHVHGMHCKACVLVTEQTLNELSSVEKAKVDMSKRSVSVSGDFGEKSKEEIAEELTLALSGKGYSLSTEEEILERNWEEFFIAAPLAIFFISAFIFLQKMGLIDLVNSESMTYGTAFMIGVIASLSSCMAVVGGLVLSLSATFAQEGKSLKPQAFFHFSRIISFFLLGGLIGLIGSAFQLSSFGVFFLGFLVGLVMLIMGINLLGVFPWVKRLQPGTPKFISRRALNVSNIAHTATPILIGIATFFLPCGFTQSMQIYALSTGDFLKGGLTMFFFALGTFPALALLSFGSSAITSGQKKGIFFKTAGLVVIAFALFNIINSLVVIGILKPVFNF